MGTVEYSPKAPDDGLRPDIVFPGRVNPEAKAELQRVLEEQEALGRGHGFNRDTGSHLTAVFGTLEGWGRVNENMFGRILIALEALEKGAVAVRSAVCKCLGAERGPKMAPIRIPDREPNFERQLYKFLQVFPYNLISGLEISRVIYLLKEKNTLREMEWGLERLQKFIGNIHIVRTALLENLEVLKDGSLESLRDRRESREREEKWLEHFEDPQSNRRPHGFEPHHAILPDDRGGHAWDVFASVDPDGTAKDGYEDGLRLEYQLKPGFEELSPEMRIRDEDLPGKIIGRRSPSKTGAGESERSKGPKRRRRRKRKGGGGRSGGSGGSSGLGSRRGGKLIL